MVRLAPIIRRQIWDGPATMKSAGQSILVVDKKHGLARLADHHVILAKGQVVWQGAGRAWASKDLMARYLGA
ncbi:MAG: hypothetical protein CM15mP115_07910 [Alphaproteobacteria bacterium]|nr:MAG: hypothetical protein CM15mP115_07910 [Alphaproteobacteria bacterium]